MAGLTRRLQRARALGRGCGWLWALGPAALCLMSDPSMASRPTRGQPVASGVSVGVGAGAGEADAPGRPRTPAEATAQHAETVRKCRLLSVAAVRDECLREAQRTLERELERLRRGAGAGR